MKVPALAQDKKPTRWMIFALFAFAPWLLTWFFSINVIVCRVDYYPCPPDVLTELLVLKKQSLLYAPIKTTINQQLITKTGFEIVQSQKILPDIIQLQLKAQAPVYALKTNHDQEIWIVTQTGQAFQASPEKSTSVPVFSLDSQFDWREERDHVETTFHQFCAELALALSQNQFEYSTISISAAKQVTILLPNNQRAILDTDDPLTQVKRLELILKGQSLQQVPGDVVEIDVRYQLPVLRTQSQLQSDKTRQP